MSLAVHARKRLSAGFVLDVSFTAAPGITMVFGESGSGKTTLLRCVAGLARPDEGRIQIGERALFDASTGVHLKPSSRRVGFVFQHLALFPHLTAADNIAYGIAQLPASERRERITTIADSFRIAHVLARRPGDISGGERQRVGLARSLVTDPEILLLDEPLSALDLPAQTRIMADLRLWNDAHRIPILQVTHSPREVLALGERVLVLQSGAIVGDGTPQEMLESPSHPHVAELAGFENLLDAVVVHRRPAAGVMTCRLAGTEVDVETPLAEMHEGQAMRIAVRAGDILVGNERPRGLSARNVIDGTVDSISREGATVRVTVNIGIPMDAHLTPSSSEELGLRPGLAVWLVIKTHSCRPVAAVRHSA